MQKWTDQVEEELALLLKEWLKAQGKTQADLRKSLKAASTRMPAILEVLKSEYAKGGMPTVVANLCIIEKDWAKGQQPKLEEEIANFNSPIDPFDQLDLLLDEIREDCDN